MQLTKERIIQHLSEAFELSRSNLDEKGALHNEIVAAWEACEEALKAQPELATVTRIEPEIPPMAIVVSGGNISEETIDALKDLMENRTKGGHVVIFQPPGMRISLVPLTTITEAVTIEPWTELVKETAPAPSPTPTPKAQGWTPEPGDWCATARNRPMREFYVRKIYPGLAPSEVADMSDLELDSYICNARKTRPEPQAPRSENDLPDDEFQRRYSDSDTENGWAPDAH